MEKNNLLCLINGESVGQVASQTLTSMRVINAVTNKPVIRPVACLDKLEIIDMPEIVDSAVNVEAFTSGKSNVEMLRSYGEEVGLTEEQITIGLSFL